MAGKTVLIIDDDEALQRIYQEKLLLEGIIAILASEGTTGLSQAQVTKPDLILLDIMLPGGMNGFDVLEKLKRNATTKQIPVIVLTNLESEEAVAKQIGATDYLVKVNTRLEDIIKKIKDILTSTN